MKSASRCSLIVMVLVSSTTALVYTRDSGVSYAKRHYKKYNDASYNVYKCVDCANFVSQCIIAALEGEQMAHGPRWTEDEWAKFQKTHSKRRYWFDHHGTLPYAPMLRNFLRDQWGLKDEPYHFIWQPGQRPQSPQGLPLQPGDVAFYGTPSCDIKHAVIITDTDGNKITFRDHCGEKDVDNLLRAWPRRKLEVFHIPDVIKNCGRLYYFYTSDSTFIFTWYVRHQFKCCWHENLGGSSPWTSNPTAYACLSWSETNGTTWDTLISPRMNFAACSAAVLRQQSISTLLHASNRTIEVRGSTDDGATWPHLIGSDTLTEAALPWAANQRNVRIAWIYKGPVQSGRYWGIDDVELWAKPSRQRDVSVSEVRSPKGILTQGPTLVPSVFVWNHGREKCLTADRWG